MKTELVTLKGNKDGVIVILDDNCLWKDLMDRLEQRLKNYGKFLHGAELIVNFGKRNLGEEHKTEIVNLITAVNLKLKRFDTTNVEETLNKEETNMQGFPANPLEEIMSETKSLVVKKNLRSGQSIHFDGSIILLGDVNPGAELIASGHIIVMGVLRGVVHAGAKGDENAVVSALKLQPTQLRIANYITRAPEDEPREPEIARVKDGLVVCEKFHINCDRLTKIC